MNPKIQLPTDNIYKFYALFGLFIFFISMWGFVTTYNYHTTLAIEIYEELEILSEIKKPSSKQKIRIKVLENTAEIYPANSEFYMTVISVGFAISTVLIIFGFGAWQFKIQPEQDELNKKQLERLELEVKLMKLQARKPSFRRRIDLE